MKTTTRPALRLIGMLLGAAFSLAAGARPTNMQELVHETQRMSEEASYMTMVWWIPQEFWEASLADNPRVTPGQRADLLSALEDLQIVALLRGKLGIGGITDVLHLDDLIAHARFELNGKVLEPLEAEKISVGAQTVLATLKPLVGGMLGQFGKGIQFVVYPSKQDNHRLIDPKTKEEFPGNFDFNPYSGGKLSSR